MLKSLTVKNFRKLREARFDFTKGLNVVRGQNEQGKSTMLEAIAYAFFSVAACRTPLAEMVTWGEKDTTLKVELVFEVEGVTYTIKRGKSGCEITYHLGDPERVVGQSECAAFIGRLFGVSSKNVNRLILSGQGNIRGALSEGSAKTAELIEQLANFSIIDDVAALIQEHRVIGSTTPFEEKAAALAAELDALQAALVPPDTATDEKRLMDLCAEAIAARTQLTTIQTALGPNVQRRDELRKLVGAKNETEGKVLQLRQQVKQTQTTLATHELARQDPPDPKEIERLKNDIAERGRIAERLKGREAVARCGYPEGNFWEGDAKSFEKAMVVCTETANALRVKEIHLTAAIATKEAEVVSAATCGHCGQDFSKLPAAMAKNATLGRELAALKLELVGVRAGYAQEEATRRALQGCLGEHQRIQGALARYGDDIAWQKDVYPWRPVWAFNPPAGAANAGDLGVLLVGLEAQDRMCTAWTGMQLAYLEADGRAKADLKVAEERLATGFPGVEALPAIEAFCDKANGEYSKLNAEIFGFEREMNEIKARVAEATAAYNRALLGVEAVSQQKESVEKTVADITFNNALLKRVRAARPVIANKLWSMVLAAVSNYFSQMRGFSSVVTKDGDGFKVDGKVIESLSGSTLDILGLAIRLALVRTFLPQTPLLILDEAAAACDDQRTEAMMGFLVSCGFDQMLLVTHEAVSSNVAENLIEI